ncbi:MAG: PA2928 family protein [Bacteroidota bacterium]
MTQGKKIITSTLLLIVLCLGGCMFFMRSCLSHYDERAALPPVLYFEKDGNQVLLAIVKYEKATSYTRRGGSVSKSVSTTYFLQSNDGTSGAKLNEQKIKHHSDIKEYPIETLGSASQLAWIFVGELMAFDPFSLEKKADIGILESKNPQLKGKFPKENQYYKFNRLTGMIAITATDGSKWELNTATLLAADISNKPTAEPFEAELMAAIKRVEDIQKEIAMSVDKQYQQQNNPSNKVRQGYFNQRDILYKKRDSLNQARYALEKLARNAKDRLRVIENLQETRMGQSYSQIKVNSDTLNGKLYGLYSSDEFKKVYDRFEYRSEYEETSRRKLLATGLTTKDDYLLVDKDNPTDLNASQSFLHGGFLLNKTNGMPIRLPNGWLVVHKSQIGKDGMIQVSNVGHDGKLLWTVNTQLPEWIDWISTPQRLYIFGVNNKDLSSSDCNVLMIIDLASGKTSGFDYFTDKPPTTN